MTGTKSTANESFVVFKAGGKQYRCANGDKILVNRLTANVGDILTLTDVLMVGNTDGSDVKVGAPLLNGASVKLKVLAHSRAKKVIIYRKNRRTGFTKKQGHRQDLTQVQVESFSA